MFKKELCIQCNLDGDCNCQKSQRRVNNCGMEQVISSNERYLRDLKNGMLTEESIKGN